MPTARRAKGPSVVPPVEIPGWEQALYRALRERLGVTDVGVNPAERSIWLMGPASKLTRLVRDARITWWNLRRMGLESTVADTGGDYGWIWEYLEYAVLATLRDVTWKVAKAAPQQVPNPRVLAERWSETEKGPWTVYPVPAPGGPQVPWWSAKQGKWMPPVEVSAWTVCAESGLVHLGWNDGPPVLSLPAPLPPILVSHGVDLAALPLIERCGGMLWPSLAVSWRVPASFGEVVFLADVRVLDAVIAKKGRTKELFLSETDAWSPTARDLMRWERAVEFELRADRKWWLGERDTSDGGWGNRWVQNELLVTWGKRPDAFYADGGLAPENAGKAVTSWRQALTRVRRMMDEHVVGNDPYVHPQRAEWDTLSESERYPYMELKVRGRVSVDTFVACAYPASAKRTVHAFLDRVGFGGWRIPVQAPLVHAHERTDAARRAWSEAMTRGILRWAESPCTAKDVPERHRRQAVRAVAPADLWSAKACLRTSFGRTQVDWERGYCYTRVPSP